MTTKEIIELLTPQIEGAIEAKRDLKLRLANIDAMAKLNGLTVDWSTGDIHNL